MKSKTNSYKEIFKATSIFGGVQIFNILILIVRSKLIAVLLGPVGMGISALLTSTISFISALTNFGLATSAVKNVSVAYSSGNVDNFSRIITVFRKLVWLTGLLGVVLTLILSPWLSMLGFHTSEYTLEFVILSITLLLTQITAGQTVVLRGTRNIKSLAKASMIGSLIGLIASAPLFYFFGTGGITPSIVLSAIASLAVSYFYSNKVKIKHLIIERRDLVTHGTEMLKMGFLISLSGLIALGASYIVRVYISHSGSLTDVGLYNAGFAIIGTYVSLVFTAMSTDYYPRLAAVSDSNLNCKNEVNQQAEIALLILAPILVVFILFIKYAILLLYSREFVSITSMVQWAALGIFFKSTSWAIGIIFLAKGASKVYFWNELAANLYLLLFNIIGYKYYGLTGLGVSFLVGYALYLAQVYFVSRRLYEFGFERKFYLLFLGQFSLAVICFIIVASTSGFLGYFLGVIVISVSISYSWREMNKRLDLNGIFKKIFKR